MSFVAVFEDSKLISAVFRAVANISSSANIYVGGSGIRFVSFDAIQVETLEVRMPQEVFYHYDYITEGDEETIAFGVDLFGVKRMLPLVKKSDSIMLGLHHWDVAYFEVRLFRGAYEDQTYIRRFLWRTIGLEEMEAPREGKEVEIGLYGGEYLISLIDAARSTGDYLEIITDVEKIKFRTQGELGIFEAPLSGAEEIVQLFRVEEEVSARYDLSCLQHVKPLLRHADTVTLMFGRDRPLALMIHIGQITAKYILLPRV